MDEALIDEAGYRHGVGIVLINMQGRVFWARRSDQTNAWQFPQGGMRVGESALQSMYRELAEEVGLQAHDVKVLGSSSEWLTYELPQRANRLIDGHQVVGQKQKWFLLQLRASDQRICLAHDTNPEFNAWRWVDFWYPLDAIVDFKRQLYKKILAEFIQIIENSQ